MFAGSPSHQSISEWRMQSIARDSEESTDDEFFDAHGKNVMILTTLCFLVYVQNKRPKLNGC